MKRRYARWALVPMFIMFSTGVRAEPHHLDTYLAAIDLPLSAELTLSVCDDTSVLLPITLDANRSLYVRARALAAYSMIANEDGVDVLTLVAGSDLPASIRLQAAISLSQVFGPRLPNLTISRLIELMPRLSDWSSMVHRFIEEISQAQRVAEDVNDVK